MAKKIVTKVLAATSMVVGLVMWIGGYTKMFEDF